MSENDFSRLNLDENYSIIMSFDKSFSDLKIAVMDLLADHDEGSCQKVLELFEKAKTAKNKDKRIAKENADNERIKAVYEAEKVVYAKITSQITASYERIRQLEQERDSWKSQFKGQNYEYLVKKQDEWCEEMLKKASSSVQRSVESSTEPQESQEICYDLTDFQ